MTRPHTFIIIIIIIIIVINISSVKWTDTELPQLTPNIATAQCDERAWVALEHTRAQGPASIMSGPARR